MNQEKIGSFIASCRKEQGFTQARLAKRLGITDRAVSKWENGRSRRMRCPHCGNVNYHKKTLSKRA